MTIAQQGVQAVAEVVEYRKGLPKRPQRMMNLPLNDKSYPVPWFVSWEDGKPEFRCMDPAKWARAVKHRLCWLCGEPLGRSMTFVAGPMCGINRTSAEPPSHHECAEYSAIACPFLTLPKAVRRTAGLPEACRMDTPTVERQIIGGTAITRNPGVAMLWTTGSYRVHRVDNGYVIEMGEPTKVEWFAEGRAAKRAEVEESIRTGMPFLQEIADKQGDGAPEHLVRCVARFQPFLPN